MTLTDFIALLEDTFCGDIGVEVMDGETFRPVTVEDLHIFGRRVDGNRKLVIGRVL